MDATTWSTRWPGVGDDICIMTRHLTGLQEEIRSWLAQVSTLISPPRSWRKPPTLPPISTWAAPGSPQPPPSPSPLPVWVTPALASWMFPLQARCKWEGQGGDQTSLSPSTMRTSLTSTKGTTQPVSSCALPWLPTLPLILQQPPVLVLLPQSQPPLHPALHSQPPLWVWCVQEAWQWQASISTQKLGHIHDCWSSEYSQFHLSGSRHCQQVVTFSQRLKSLTFPSIPCTPLKPTPNASLVTPRNKTPDSRHTTPHSTPMGCTSTHPDPACFAAILEGRGSAKGEVGIAAICLTNPMVVLCQFSDSSTYPRTLTKLLSINPAQIITPDTGSAGVKLYEDIASHLQLSTVVPVQRKHFNESKGLSVLHKRFLGVKTPLEIAHVINRYIYQKVSDLQYLARCRCIGRYR